MHLRKFVLLSASSLGFIVAHSDVCGKGRELAWETWRRNDAIRFGKYEDKWGLKTNAEVYRRIFPIPQVALTNNPKLKQNPGY